MKENIIIALLILLIGINGYRLHIEQNLISPKIRIAPMIRTRDCVYPYFKHVDWPEEISQVTHDRSKPDLLYVWQGGDTLYSEFGDQ